MVKLDELLPVLTKTTVVKVIQDPFGRNVNIGDCLLQESERLRQSEDVEDDVCTVIKKPVMMFRLKGIDEFFYLRAIGWNRMLLVHVQKVDQHFEAVSSELDPSVDRLLELHQKCERLL